MTKVKSVVISEFHHKRLEKVREHMGKRNYKQTVEQLIDAYIIFMRKQA